MVRSARRTGPDLSGVPGEYANKITGGHVKLIYHVTNRAVMTNLVHRMKEDIYIAQRLEDGVMFHIQSVPALV